MATTQIISANDRGIFAPQRIDISNVNEEVIFDVQRWGSFTVQAVEDGVVTIGSLVLKVQVSNDGCNPEDFPSGAITRSSAGITATQNVLAIRYVHCIVTTAGTGGYFKLIAQAQELAV